MTSVVDTPPASEWPFRHPLCPALPDGPVEIRATNVSQAYVNAQSGTQLVTTQKTYLDAEWDAALSGHGSARLASFLEECRAAGEREGWVSFEDILREFSVPEALQP